MPGATEVRHTDPPALAEGVVAAVEFRGGTVEGRIVEVRAETADVRRVVLSPFGEDVEIDTDADRVELRDPARVCAACGVEWDDPPTYRCPDCGADLVGE